MRKSIIAAVGATAMFAVVGGSVVYADNSKHVTLSVDGQLEKVHTFGSTVADALAEKKIQVGQHDLVAPSLDAKLQDGQEIAVQYGRQLTVTADGKAALRSSAALSVALAGGLRRGRNWRRLRLHRLGGAGDFCDRGGRWQAIKRHVNQCCVTTCCGRPRCRLKSFPLGSAGIVDMHMRIDESGKNH